MTRSRLHLQSVANGSLAAVVDRQLADALSRSEDHGVITAEAGWCAPAHKHGHVVTLSRALALDAGLVTPTPQETADRAAWVAVNRVERAALEQARAAWFEAVLAAAGPVGVAILKTHVPGEFGDCEGDGFDMFAGLTWPCATLIVGAEAAGVPIPEEIW